MTEKRETMAPTVGQIVHYTLSSFDAGEVYRRREVTGFSVNEKGVLDDDSHWHAGTQRHVGYAPSPGEVLPAIIVRTYEGSMCDLQVFLNGNDVLWVTGRFQGEGPGCWREPA